MANVMRSDNGDVKREGNDGLIGKNGMRIRGKTFYFKKHEQKLQKIFFLILNTVYFKLNDFLPYHHSI